LGGVTVDSLKTQARNFKLLYGDALLWQFTQIVVAFGGTFAIRLGASNTAVSLMSSIPSFIVILVSIPFGRFLQNSSRKLFWYLSGISGYRIFFILMALAPFVHFHFLTPGTYFVVIWVLATVPYTMFSIANVGMMMDLVPANHRAMVFTNRSLIGSLVTIAGVFLGGQWLSHYQFPGNYQWLFATMGSLALFNLFVWLYMRFPAKGERLIPDRNQHPIISQLHQMSEIFRNYPLFTRYTINQFLWSIGIWATGPLFILYAVRQLSASDA
jgi:hypothetical protein